MKQMITLILLTAGLTPSLNHAIISLGVAQDANTRYKGRMEDRFIMLDDDIFAVFDGHAGQGTAQYIVDKAQYKYPRVVEFVRYFQNKHKFNDANALTATLAALEKRLWQKKDEKNEYGYINHYAFFGKPLEIYGESGATAVIAKLTDNVLTVANVGDSRAVLVRQGCVLQTTRDHKPDAPTERDRVLKAGGKITHFPRDCPRVNGFALSRTMGDIFAKHGAGQSENSVNPPLSATPDIYQWGIRKKDLLIIASDGLWDAMDKQPNDNKILEQILDTSLTPQKLATHLMNEAKKRGSCDNITVLVIKF